MKTFLTLSLLTLTIACNGELHRKAMQFEGTEQFDVVSLYGANQEKGLGSMSLSNSEVNISSGVCSFGGVYSVDNANLKFAFSDARRSAFTCEGLYFDLEAKMGGLVDSSKGYGLKLDVFNSDWVVLGVDNESSQKIDMIVGQKLRVNPHSLNP